MKLKYYFLTLILFAFSTTLVQAQRPNEDVRPLQKKVDPSAFLPLQSFQVKAKASGKASLLPNQTGRPARLTSVPVSVSNGISGMQKKVQKKISLHSGPVIIRKKNGTVNWMTGELGQLPAMKSKSKAAIGNAAIEMLESFKETLNIDNPSDVLAPEAVLEDELGFVHVRLAQKLDEVPVWGSDLYMHFNKDGELYAINGSYSPEKTKRTSFKLTSDDISDIVIDDLKALGKWKPLNGELSGILTGEQEVPGKIYYPVNGNELVPSYELSIHANLVEHFTYIVDAETGSVLNKFSNHCSVVHSDNGANVDIPEIDASKLKLDLRAGTFTNGSGTDLNGVNQSFRVYQHDDGLYYSVWDLDNLDLGKSQLPSELAGGALTISANNQDLDDETELLHVTSNTNSWSDASGISAHVNMNIAYDYFKNTHSRNAIDGNDQSIISIIHATEGGQSMENAYWNGRTMIYGDGLEYFKPFAGALDVAGHEMSHGVVQHTAGLVYQFQSGALNESYADIFGVLIENEDFLLAEDIMQPGKGVALRDLLNPDNSQVLDPQPAHMNQYRNLTAEQDNGGVHINSGIPNRAAALVIQELGNDKAGRIFYRALSNYMTRNSEFSDARLAAEQAATDLFGEGAELTAVQNAYESVGITTTGNTTDDSENDVNPVEGGVSLITFLLSDGTIGLMDVTDDQIEVGAYNATAKADVTSGFFSQLTTGLNGERIWYINPQGFLEYVNVSTEEIFTYNDLYLNEPGDLWNASISPDENYVALVSAYADDPNLYIFDGTDLYYVELKAETTQEGIYDETIQFPDVISWSRNMNEPTIIFDAYRELTIAGSDEPYGMWSIYMIDFESGRVLDLVPSQPSGISLGNVAYSNTNPDIITFNEFDAEYGWFDTIVANFETSGYYYLNVPSVSWYADNIVDGQFPTFSPNDNVIAFSSTEASLIFYDLNQDYTQNIQWVDLGESGSVLQTYKPYWFVLGGTQATDIEFETAEEVVSDLKLLNNYPNPFNPSTQINFTVPEAGDITLKVYDAVGREVAVLVDSRYAAGEHQVSFNAGNLPSGVYFVRLTSAQSVSRSKITLIK